MKYHQKLFFMVGILVAASTGVHAASDFPVEASMVKEEVQAGAVAQGAPASMAQWSANAGDTLHETVEKWAQTASYQIVWDASYDFPIRAGFHLEGDFFQALKQLFEAYERADRPLRVDVYKAQNLVHIQAAGE